jgi:hypothetical protein
MFDAVCFARMIGVVVEPRVIDAGKMEGFTPPDTVAGAGIESAVTDDDLVWGFLSQAGCRIFPSSVSWFDLARPHPDCGAVGMTIRGERAFGRDSIAPQPCIR